MWQIEDNFDGWHELQARNNNEVNSNRASISLRDEKRYYRPTIRHTNLFINSYIFFYLDWNYFHEGFKSCLVFCGCPTFEYYRRYTNAVALIAQSPRAMLHQSCSRDRMGWSRHSSKRNNSSYASSRLRSPLAPLTVLM